MSSKKLAVILSGCGFMDGAEIRESVLTLLALDTKKIDYDIYAPDKDQFHVIDHMNGTTVDGKRNVLEESARIARGKVGPLNKLNTNDYDGLVIPGGFGVAKNLCSFATEGAKATVEAEVKEIIVTCHKQKKAITAICIAPALIALCIHGVTLTIGTDQGTADTLKSMGANHIETQSNEFIVDENNKIVTTAAYMHDHATLDQIYTGISGAIGAMLNI